MDKREFERRIVPDLLDLFDQRDELQRSYDELRQAISTNTIHTAEDMEMLRLGKRLTFKECTWGELEKEEGETFETWCSRYVYRVPDSMSRSKFYAYFARELKEAWNALQ